MGRADMLIKQSDFTGARLLLERALEKGSARAAFMMAETYDWRTLRALRAYGVRGDPEKARELYELAAVAGIEHAQERLEALQPAYGGSVAYGDRAEHCWNGDPKQPNAYSRLHYNFQYLPQILERIKASAPAGADLKSWRY